MIEITMAGPGKNALGTGMMNFLLDRLQAAAGQPVLLTGAGDAFSAGLDLKEVASLDEERAIAFLRLLERCMTALYLYPGPTVALVNGHAIAGGCVLTLCCDHRVALASPRAKIGLNEVPLGLRFPPRVFSIVRRRVPAFAREVVFLGGGLHDFERARELGLVDEVTADPAVARARLAALASHPADAYALVKHDLRGTAEDLCPEAEQEPRLREDALRWTSPALRATIARVLAR